MRGPRQIIRESVTFPSRISRAYLAEDYDGISQWVMVKLARGSTSVGYKVRVAAGDHSGCRPMPENTPVVITSIHGTIEALLGQYLPPGVGTQWTLAADFPANLVGPAPGAGPTGRTQLWWRLIDWKEDTTQLLSTQVFPVERADFGAYGAELFFEVNVLDKLVVPQVLGSVYAYAVPDQSHGSSTGPFPSLTASDGDYALGVVHTNPNPTGLSWQGRWDQLVNIDRNGVSRARVLLAQAPHTLDPLLLNGGQPAFTMSLAGNETQWLLGQVAFSGLGEVVQQSSAFTASISTFSVTLTLPSAPQPYNALFWLHSCGAGLGIAPSIGIRPPVIVIPRCPPGTVSNPKHIEN